MRFMFYFSRARDTGWATTAARMRPRIYLMNGALWRQFIGCCRILILSLPWEIRGFNPWNEPFDAGPGRAGRNARRSPGPGGSFGLACNFVRGASALYVLPYRCFNPVSEVNRPLTVQTVSAAGGPPARVRPVQHFIHRAAGETGAYVR